MYISYDAIYCNDRSAGEGYASSGSMYYSGVPRLSNKKQPSYQCGMNTTGGYVNTSGSWTETGIAGRLYSDASDQDKFREGVGLMTADEVAMAGGVYGSNAPNTYYYRNSISDCSTVNCSVTGSTNWWTMSPYSYDGSYARTFYVVGSSLPGYLINNGVNDTYGVRPVLSINSTALVSGSGTVDDPYVVVVI